jgi:hypothetical protein
MRRIYEGLRTRGESVTEPRDSTLESLLQFVAEDGRVCPMPDYWHRLWEMLPDRRPTGSGWNPPVPLILAGWWASNDEIKRERLAAHLRDAAAHGVLAQVDRYVRTLPEKAWRRVREVSDSGGDGHARSAQERFHE